jgi:hypothetical protein
MYRTCVLGCTRSSTYGGRSDRSSSVVTAGMVAGRPAGGRGGPYRPDPTTREQLLPTKLTAIAITACMSVCAYSYVIEVVTRFIQLRRTCIIIYAYAYAMHDHQWTLLKKTKFI